MLAASPLGGLVKSKGIDLDALVEQMLDADARVVEGLPEHVTTCLHQCRGNYAPRHMTPHDHIGELGETFFSLPYDRFTLEWDGHVERTVADFAALERVPRHGPTVVLGVVSTRHRELESADSIAATVERASRHVPLDQLAISPQCGFSSALTTGDDYRPDGNSSTRTPNGASSNCSWRPRSGSGGDRPRTGPPERFRQWEADHRPLVAAGGLNAGGAPRCTPW